MENAVVEMDASNGETNSSGVESSDSGKLTDPGGFANQPKLSHSLHVCSHLTETTPSPTDMIKDMQSTPGDSRASDGGLITGGSMFSSSSSTPSSTAASASLNSLSSSGSSQASSSGVSLSSPGGTTCSSTPGEELVPHEVNCSPPTTPGGEAEGSSDTGVESGASSCATIVQEEHVGDESNPPLDDECGGGRGDGTTDDSASTLSQSSLSDISSGECLPGTRLEKERRQSEERTAAGARLNQRLLPPQTADNNNHAVESQHLEEKPHQLLPEALEQELEEHQQQQHWQPKACLAVVVGPSLTEQHPPPSITTTTTTAAAINGVSAALAGGGGRRTRVQPLLQPVPTEGAVDINEPQQYPKAAGVYTCSSASRSSSGGVVDDNNHSSRAQEVPLRYPCGHYVVLPSAGGGDKTLVNNVRKAGGSTNNSNSPAVKRPLPVGNNTPSGIRHGLLRNITGSKHPSTPPPLYPKPSKALRFNNRNNIGGTPGGAAAPQPLQQLDPRSLAAQLTSPPVAGGPVAIASPSLCTATACRRCGGRIRSGSSTATSGTPGTVTTTCRLDYDVAAAVTDFTDTSALLPGDELLRAGQSCCCTPTDTNSEYPPLHHLQIQSGGDGLKAVVAASTKGIRPLDSICGSIIDGTGLAAGSGTTTCLDSSNAGSGGGGGVSGGSSASSGASGGGGGENGLLVLGGARLAGVTHSHVGPRSRHHAHTVSTGGKGITEEPPYTGNTEGRNTVSIAEEPSSSHSGLVAVDTNTTLVSNNTGLSGRSPSWAKTKAATAHRLQGRSTAITNAGTNTIHATTGSSHTGSGTNITSLAPSCPNNTGLLQSTTHNQQQGGQRSGNTSCGIFLSNNSNNKKFLVCDVLEKAVHKSKHPVKSNGNETCSSHKPSPTAAVIEEAVVGEDNLPPPAVTSNNNSNSSSATTTKNNSNKKPSYKLSLIKRYKAYRAAKIESQRQQQLLHQQQEQHQQQHHQLEQQQQQHQIQSRRRASIETIMEFDSNFHGNDDEEDEGLDSPMSDCTSLFSLGSEAEACLQEVMEGLGEDYCLTGAAVSSGEDEDDDEGDRRGALEGRSLRHWDKGRRKVKRPRNLQTSIASGSKSSEYQELKQQCDSTTTGTNNVNNQSMSSNNSSSASSGTSRARFVVQVDGQRLTPDEQAESILPSQTDFKRGPLMEESSFMEVDNNHVPSVSQPCSPSMPDLGIPANALMNNANSLSAEYPSTNDNSIEKAKAVKGSRRQMEHTYQFPQIQSPNGNTPNTKQLISTQGPLPSSNSTSPSDSSSTPTTTGVPRPDVLLLNRTPALGAANSRVSPGAVRSLPSPGSLPQSATQQVCSPVQHPRPTNSYPNAQPPGGSYVPPPGAVVLTPGGHRCCTCGQTVPPAGFPPGDNANNGDSVNGNLVVATANGTIGSSTTVVAADIHTQPPPSSAEITGDNKNPDDSNTTIMLDPDDPSVPPAMPPPRQSLASIMSPMTPAQRFAYIEALQKEKQRNSIKGQSLAPPLHDNLRYHAFFLYHNNDRDWVLNVMEKLESPTLGFKCCCHERDLDCSLSLPQAVLYGMKNSVKTVVVLSPDFVTSTWSSCEVVVSEMDSMALRRDLLLVMLQDCDMPNIVTDLPYIDASKRDWWTKMLATLALPDDTPMTEETVLSMSSSLVGLNPGLQSGHLLHSIKSKCLCCGRELVDPTEVPDELIAHGVQIPPEEYCQAIRQLMCESKFRCHIWCYNMPAATVFFTLFLGLCLAVIPVIETKYMFIGTDLTHPSLPTPASKGVSVKPSKKQTGLEYVHGAVVWLCVLTLYMLCTHLARRKMKEKTYRRLSEVNTVFIKYNLLVGVENLGLADCNKYYLHFFYFELGPCLAYLQELVDNLEDVSPCYTNQAYLQELLVNLEECTPCYSNQAMDNDAQLEDPEDPDGCQNEASASDRMNVLEQNTITNVSMQTHAEDLLLDHSGEYLNMLITKKLDRPRKQRHVKGAYCLCQFVEQRVYKMVV